MKYFICDCPRILLCGVWKNLAEGMVEELLTHEGVTIIRSNCENCAVIDFERTACIDEQGKGRAMKKKKPAIPKPQTDEKTKNRIKNFKYDTPTERYIERTFATKGRDGVWRVGIAHDDL